MKAYLNLRDRVDDRARAVENGFRRMGYKPVHGKPPRCDPGDIFMSWNLLGGTAQIADKVSQCGGIVLVIENAYLGNDFAGDRWYAISKDFHNGAGSWPAGGAERWDGLGIDLEPYREGGMDVVLLPQRGIGSIGVRMPYEWPDQARAALAAHGYRIRTRIHPGKHPPQVSLADDLAKAHAAATWGSGAAIKALAIGVPVFSSWPRWIGASACRPIEEADKGPLRDDAARLAMFRRLIWAQWRLAEIDSGEAFARLLGR